jgi:hypothetical protein
LAFCLLATALGDIKSALPIRECDKRQCTLKHADAHKLEAPTSQRQDHKWGNLPFTRCYSY